MNPTFKGIGVAALLVFGLSPSFARGGESAAVRGRVIMESDSKPVANAEVRLVTWKDNNTRYDVKKAKSDERGEFVFENVGPGRHQLIAFYEDFASRQSRYKGEGGDLSAKEAVTLKLRKMPHIDVRVVSQSSDKPIEDALVHLTWTDRDHDHRTDKDGSVVLRTLTREVWRVEAKAKGFAEQEQDVNLTDSDAARITFELEPGGVIFGTIRDEGGKPMPDVGVSVSDADRRGPSEYMKTAADGRFRFEFVSLHEKLRLGASADDYLRFEELFALTDSSSAEREFDIVLKHRPHGGNVIGTVHDAQGKSIAGASVSNHGRSSRDVRTTTTDEQGVFALDDVFEGSLGYELVVKAQGFAPQQLPFKPGTKEKPGEVDITLEKGHEIRARVVNESGKPVAGAFVYYEVSRGSSMEINGRTTTDANGNFDFDSLPEKPVFQVRADGYSEFDSAELPLDGNERVTVTLEPEGMVRGKVVDAETRKPLQTFNVKITFSPDRRPDDPGHQLSGARATSRDGERFVSPDGLFTIKDLVRKMPLQVTVAAEEYERGTYRRVVAEAGDEAEVIVFPLLPIDKSKLTTIRGRIVDSRGAGIAGAELRLIVTDGRPAQRDRFPYNWQMVQSGQTGSIAEVSQFVAAVSDADGKFRFEKVRPGLDMEIAYWGEGVSQGRVNGIQRLSEEERENVLLTNVTPGVVRGTIDRKTLPKASSVTLIAIGAGPFGGDFSDHLRLVNSSYEIRNVPPGSYQVLVYGEATRTGNEGFRRKVEQRHAVEVPSGETVVFDLGTEPDPSGGKPEK